MGIGSRGHHEIRDSFRAYYDGRTGNNNTKGRPQVTKYVVVAPHMSYSQNSLSGDI